MATIRTFLVGVQAHTPVGCLITSGPNKVQTLRKTRIKPKRSLQASTALLFIQSSVWKRKWRILVCERLMLFRGCSNREANYLVYLAGVPNSCSWSVNLLSSLFPSCCCPIPNLFETDNFLEYALKLSSLSMSMISIKKVWTDADKN